MRTMLYILKKITTGLLFGLCLINARLTYAQQENNTKYLQELVAIDALAYDKKFDKHSKSSYIHYTSTVIDGEGDTHTSTTKFYRGYQCAHLFSSEADFYMDAQHFILVLNKTRTIVIDDNTDPTKNMDLSSQMKELRTEFFKSCVLESYQELDKHKRKMVLKLPDNLHKIMNTRKMTFIYDVHEKKIIKNEIEYATGYKYKKMTIEYHELNLSAAYRFKATALEEVMWKNKLLEKYKGYEVIDNRENK